MSITDSNPNWCEGGEDCPSNIFSDVDTDKWYHEAVDYVVEAGLMGGTGGDTFEPDTSTDRAMIAAVIYRLAGEPDMPEENWGEAYTDVAGDRWYAQSVYWARAEEVLEGYGDGRFGPADRITREQMAAALYRYAGSPDADVSVLESYTDCESVSSWAREAMAWAVAEGLINGVDGNALAPQGSAIRAQAATILMRFCENIAQ